MSIKISGENYTKYDFSSGQYKYYEENMRNLIVNGVEKYRLVVGGSNKLVWAKGKINFDLNFPKDGSGESIERHYDNLLSELVLPRSLYAFYNDGFYKKGGQFLWNNRITTLDNNTFYNFSHINNSLANLVFLWFGGGKSFFDSFYNPATFEGWWTVKDSTGGIRVDKITDVPKTGLFDYKKSTDLPEITLYARWKIKTCSLTIKNITRKDGSKSSFSYYDSNKKKWIKTSDKHPSCRYEAPWGTPIKNIIDKNIKDVKYITWAKNVLADNKKENKIRKGVQKFLGWQSGDDDGRGWSNSTELGKLSAKNETIYPAFEILIIWKGGKNWQNKQVKEGYLHCDLGGTFYELLTKKKGDHWYSWAYNPELNKEHDRLEHWTWPNNRYWYNCDPIHTGTYILEPKKK